jgi:Protein of unknown function (DUF2804)
MRAQVPAAALPYRGAFGDARPSQLGMLALPPDRMPSRWGTRPLKSWRYVGVYGKEMMLCLASVRVGPARQCFWAVWDRGAGRLLERTRLGGAAVTLALGSAHVRDGPVQIEIELAETPGVETVCRTGSAYAWTRKQGGIATRCAVVIDGARRTLTARAVVDDTAGYYERHTAWSWSAGVGTADDGRELAWNLVEGVNDPPRESERTIWVDGEPHEAGPVHFAPDLSGVDALAFSPEAVRENATNMLLVRSAYRQPFGTFSGKLPDGIQVAEGYGVMESHDAWW